MRDTNRQPDDRLMALLAEEALFGLSNAGRHELDQHAALGGPRAGDPDSLALAAAALYELFDLRAGATHEPMPEALHAKILKQGWAAVSKNRPGGPSDRG